jgi:hypothetical protein
VTDNVTILTCNRCADPIECCEFCDEQNCPAAVCAACVRFVLVERVPQAHAQGG